MMREPPLIKPFFALFTLTFEIWGCAISLSKLIIAEAFEGEG